ncbi:biotin-dependent carboxyltransferase family protein [Fodinicurvata sp. EGI_FJ10296]|uniref:5-oxoprolinase subunit C family protein n=1 Tax=Fodinicurvata sp. EGI_FJ10296 TaxID=3231908 RepID=UPI003454CADD
MGSTPTNMTAGESDTPRRRAALRIVQAGPLDLIQDGGRIGFQRYGVGPSGAMDSRALAVANALVGNAPDAPAIEFLQASSTIEAVDGPLRIAVAGAPGPVDLNGRVWESNRSFTLAPGDRLRAGPRSEGQRGYIAVAGRFCLTPVMGSYSTHLRAGFGGLDGRALAPGDILDVSGAAPPDGPDSLFPDDAWIGGRPVAAPETATDAMGEITSDGPATVIRVLAGPQDDHFTPEAIETFTRSVYVISKDADRMGYRLTGPTLAHADGYNIVSDAIATGSVQVPGAGTPIILLADRQTTGGFPKIATVVSADLPRLAQLGPGDGLRFRFVSAADAAKLAVADHDWKAGLPSHLQPAVLRPEDMTAEHLLEHNLVTAFWQPTDDNFPFRG